MKIEVPHERLLKAVSLAEKVSGKNLTLPVLNCLFLLVKGGILIIKSTNLDIGVEIKIPVKVFSEGEVAVSGSVLQHTLSSIYEGKTVSLSIKDGNLLVSTTNSKTLIKAQPHEDFPTIPHPQDAQVFKIDPHVFIDGIKSVWYSASLLSIKPELSSVYIYQYDKKIYFVSTDSFRLAEKYIPIKNSIPEFDPILIPFKNVPEIIRILENSDEEVEVAMTQNQISFSYDSVYITSRLIDGTFPDYKQIIPKDIKTEVVVLKQDVVSVLKKTTIFSDTFNQLRFNTQVAQKRFTISSKNTDIGETVDIVHAAISGESLEISFNHKYLTDCFQAIHSDSVSFSFGGLSKPLVIRGVSDTSFLYLVMPMNK